MNAAPSLVPRWNIIRLAFARLPPHLTDVEHAAGMAHRAQQQGVAEPVVIGAFDGEHRKVLRGDGTVAHDVDPNCDGINVSEVER